MLTARGRQVRAAITAVTLVLLLAGTLWGQDDHFPLGPFRMYAYATKNTGRVTVPKLEGVTASGDTVGIGAAMLGLRRAEIEGQIHRFRSDPRQLADVVAAYEAFQPRAEQLVELRLIYRVRRLEEGRATRYEEQTLAVWRR